MAGASCVSSVREIVAPLASMRPAMEEAIRSAGFVTFAGSMIPDLSCPRRPRSPPRRRPLSFPDPQLAQEGRIPEPPSRTMSSFSSTVCAAPSRATWSMARATSSVVVTCRGATRRRSGKSHPVAA